MPNYEDMIDGGWDAYVQSRLNAADAKIGDDGVHYFLDSGSAYGETQCNDKIKDGDILVVESEKIVGILYDVAWPVAITEAVGEFGSFRDDALPKEDYAGQLAEATKLAKKLGFPLQERFA